MTGSSEVPAVPIPINRNVTEIGAMRAIILGKG